MALTGTLWRYNTSVRIPNATVSLQRASHGGTNWTTIRSTRTSATGRFAFTVTQGRPYDYRARWAGSATYTAAVTPGWTQGASGASTATRWRQVDAARLIADVQPRTTRWVEAGTSSCRSIHIAASTRYLDSAPLVTVTSGGRQLYGGRFNHDSFGNWFINTTSGMASEFRTHLEGVCFT